MSEETKAEARPSVTDMGVGDHLPMEVLDKCIGQQVWIIMKGDSEYSGQLRGFDKQFHLILDNAKEYKLAGAGAARTLVNTLPSLMLNGHHIAMLVPGSEAPRAAGEL